MASEYYQDKDHGDVEVGKGPIVIDPSDNSRTGSIEEIRRTKQIQNSVTPLRKLREAEEWMDRKLGGDGFVETQGIDRIPEAERRPPSIWNIFFMWFSMVMHVGTIPLGVLGPEFGLNFKQSMSAVVVGICAGACFPAYTGTLGPKLGLRQIAASRYSFGFYGAKLCSALNVVVGAGFAVVNVVVVGQILSAVSDYRMSLAVGCVIIALVSYVLSVFGFRLIHTFEKYAWIPGFIVFLVLYAQIGPKLDTSTPGLDSGLSAAGSWLSIMAIQFSSASGWCSMAADYYVNYPSNTSPVKIFALTWSGIALPTIFTTSLGVILGQVAILTAVPAYNEAYESHGLGGLLLESWHPVGWSKFALVISTFTVCGNNIAINYSSGLSLQLLGHWFHAVPRFVWSFLVALIVAVLAIAGREHLSAIVSNFVSLLGYWTVAFTFILAMENFIFRRRAGYNLTSWDQPEKLPLGLAATFTLIASYCGGGVPGMSQTWFVGPVAAYFGPFGGDVGLFMSAAITLLLYPGLRYLEKKYTGR